jgi:Tfp pilus assembly major pilin PilA
MKKIRSKKFQRGLSLLMTMALLAIIGILAEVSFSAYEDYVAQEQVTKQ